MTVAGRVARSSDRPVSEGLEDRARTLLGQVDPSAPQFEPIDRRGNLPELRVIARGTRHDKCLDRRGWFKRGRTAGQATEVNGMTGKLRIDANNRIRRELDWAQIRNGIPARL